MSVDWLEADWDAPPGVVAGTSLRRGGVSSGAFAALNLGAHVGDDPATVRENRQRLITGCGLPAEPYWLKQTHSINVLGNGMHNPDRGADARVTTAVEDVCVVLTADCLPVILAANDGSEVAAAHAGWRGLAGGILEATLAAMTTPKHRIKAWLGPAISQVAFEVGGEVREQFVRHDAAAMAHFVENERDRYQADLYGLARQRLLAQDVADVAGGERCTYREDEHFFSYRRDGQCGRMATFVFRR